MPQTPFHAYYKARLLEQLPEAEQFIPVFASSDIEIYPFQIAAASFALRSPYQKGAVLCDEAGMGKSHEAMLVINQKWLEGCSRILLVIPNADLLHQWTEMLERFYTVPYVVLTNRDQWRQNTSEDNSNAFIQDAIVITTYDFAADNEEAAKVVNWDLTVFEEANALSPVYQEDNKQAKALKRIAGDSFKLLLTGTPIEKNIMDLYGLIWFIDKTLLPGEKEFLARYLRRPENYPELSERVSRYCFRTLRSQAKHYAKVTERVLLTVEYTPGKAERQLYDLLYAYINQPEKRAFPEMNQYDLALRLLGLLGSSTAAILQTIKGIVKRLQGLEKEKLQNEYKELEARIAYFNELLSSEEKIRGVLKDELTAIRDRYGDDRVTEIQDVEDEIDIEDLIEEEECVFTLTAGGYIKRTAASTYKAQRRGGKGITAMSTKEEDYVDTVFTASTHDFILFFTNKGRVHRKKGYQIPEAGRTARGTNLVNVLPIEQDEKVTAMIHLREFPEDRYLVMVTRSGTVKRIQLSSIYTARKAGIRCITLEEGDELICVRETDGEQALLIATHDGMTISFLESDVRCMGRDASGVMGIRLRDGDYVVGAARAKRDHQVLMITENGYGKRTDMDEYIRADGPQKRGGFGLKGYNITEKTGPVVGVKVVSDGDDVLVINDAGVIIRMAAAGISTYGRTAQGVKIMNLEEGVKVISFARTDHEEEEEAAEGETPAGGPEQA